MRTRFPDPAILWTDDDARTVLDEWRRSGDSMAAFARKHGVSAARLYWWKGRLRGVPAAPTGPTVSLVPASVVSSGSATLTIRLPGEVVIEVMDASPTWVAVMVAELRRSPQ